MPEDAIKIFYSYSRKDLDMRDRLDIHLSPLRNANKISTWHDLQLEAGEEWEPAILNKLDTADIILLLVSGDFIHSEYCFGTELQRAIARHHQRTARVIPIILRPCDWNHSDVPFSKLNVLPTHAQPISKWEDPEEAFAIVAQRIRETVDQLRSEKLAQRQAEERQRQQLLAQKEAEQQRQKLLAQKEAEQQAKQTSDLSLAKTDQPQVTPPKAYPLSQAPSFVSKNIASDPLNQNYPQQVPERPHKERLAHYQSQYLDASRRKYPVSESDRHALESLRQVLRLSVTDVQEVEKRIELARRPINKPNSPSVQTSATQTSAVPTTPTSAGEQPADTNWAEGAARRVKRVGINWAEEIVKKLKKDMD